jgi:hypothetical protein
MECGHYDERVPRSRIRCDRRSAGNAKAHVQEVLATLAEDVSFEEIQYHIDLRRKIEQGWDQRDADMEEIRRRLTNWLARWTGRSWSAAR